MMRVEVPNSQEQGASKIQYSTLTMTKIKTTRRLRVLPLA